MLPMALHNHHKPALPRSLLFYSDYGKVGDGLILLPGIRRLRALFPQTHVVWLTGLEKNTLGTVLEPLAAEFIDEFIDSYPIGDSWKDLLRRPLPQRHFDIVIDCQTTLRRTLALRRISHGMFVSSAAGFRLSHRRPDPPVKPIMVQQRFLQLLSFAADRSCEPEFTVNLPSQYRQLARSLLPPGSTYIGLAPGAGDRRKRWPLDCYIELAKQQLAKGRCAVFFIGPKEHDELDQIRAAVPDAKFPEWEFNHAEIRPSPTLTIALAERLSASVANDSGVGHLLGAGRQPLISLFGPKSAEKFRVTSTPTWVPVDASEYGGTDPGLIPVDRVANELEQILASGR